MRRKSCPFCGRQLYGIDYKIMSIYRGLSSQQKHEALRFYQFILQQRKYKKGAV